MKAFLILSSAEYSLRPSFYRNTPSPNSDNVGAAGAQLVTHFAVRVMVVDVFYDDFTMCAVMLT